MINIHFCCCRDFFGIKTRGHSRSKTERFKSDMQSQRVTIYNVGRFYTYSWKVSNKDLKFCPTALKNKEGIF